MRKEIKKESNGNKNKCVCGEKIKHGQQVFSLEATSGKKIPVHLDKRCLYAAQSTKLIKPTPNNNTIIHKMNKLLSL